MSERASDEHLALLERALGNIENDYRPTCESVNYGSGCPGPTSASIEFWRRAVDAMPSMLAELRERRLADHAVAMVTQLAREVLAERPPIPGMPNTVHDELTAAVTALDALLGDRR